MSLEPNTEYHKVEKPAIEQLEALGYTYVFGGDLAPDTQLAERVSFRDVVLAKHLKEALVRINPWISEENLAKVMRELIHIQTSSLMEANQWFYERLVKYMSVEQDLGSGRKSQTVKIIDFDNPDNNEFLVANQFKVQGAKPPAIVPDIIIFVNGLPLIVIECKSPYTINPMEEGIKQLLRYANRRNPEENEGAERLFHYNQVMISTCRDEARMATINGSYEHYLEWKDPYPLKITDLGNNPTSQETLIAGMLDKRNLLDIIQNFIVFEPVDGKVIKKVCRYHQFRAVHKAIARLKTGHNRRDKGGIIWHTQGSGKSLSMVFLANKMRREPELKDYKIVFVTDRTDLDRQLTDTFRRCQDETVYHARSIKHFKELLQKDSSDLVMGMLQKFSESELGSLGVVNRSEKIVLMVDEVHRGHYGPTESILNSALPNAPKIGFTGTPLIKTQKTTHEYGTYIDTYTIDQSVRDGATVQIIYEGRESNTKVTGDSLDKLFDFYFADKSEDEKESIKRKYGTEIAVLEAPKRIEMICVDILSHYREHIQPNGFKAQIVTASRRAAIIYKQILDKLGAPESAVVVSGLHNDEPFFHPYTDPAKHKQIIQRFKKPMSEDGLSFLIVKDMLITGFDAPVEQVMYLDRKLTDHNLLQAIARVNRVRIGKHRGYIVDYYGLSDYLAEALEVFTSEDVQGALIPIKDEVPKLEQRYIKVKSYFGKLDLRDVDACVDVLADDEVRSDFESDFRKFLQSMEIIMPNSAAAPFVPDMRLLGKIHHSARNRYRDLALTIAGCEEKVRKLIEEHIYSTGVDPKIEPIALLSPNFRAHVDEVKSPKAKASEIEHAIRHHITVNLGRDPEYYTSLSKRLEQIIQAFKDNWELLAQQLLDFRNSIETEHTKKSEDLGLSQTEYAFFNILAAEVYGGGSGEPALSGAQKTELVRVTGEIVQTIEDVAYIVDFFKKEDEQKRIRLLLKRKLMETSFGDNDAMRKRIINRFMELAKARFGQG